MTVADLKARLDELDPALPVAILVATDGDGIDLAQPAGALVSLGHVRRPFSGGLVLAGNVLVLVAADSAGHALLTGRRA